MSKDYREKFRHIFIHQGDHISRRALMAGMFLGPYLCAVRTGWGGGSLKADNTVLKSYVFDNE